MTVILSYIFYFVVSSAGPIWQRHVIKKTNSENPGQIDLAFKVMLITCIFGLLTPLFSPFYISGSALWLVVLSLICGICGAGFFICYFVVQKHMEAGIVNLISNLRTPVAILLASIFLNESLTSIQAVGAIILLSAIFLVSNRYRTKLFHFDKYFLLMVLGAVLLSGVLVAERALQKTTGFSAGTIFSWVAQAFFLGLVALYTKSKQIYTSKEVVITGVLSAVGSLAYVIVVTVVGNLSVAITVISFRIMIIYILAAIFLNEREDLPRKILGSIIAVIGLLLMK